MWALGRIRVVAGLVGGSDEELKALGVARRRAGVAIHIAATDPAGAGRNANLIPVAVVARGRAGRVGTVPEIVTRRGGVIAARIANRIVDRVMPVVIVVGGAAVPTAVMRLQRRMVPLHPGVLHRDDDALPRVSHGPHRRSVDVTHAPFDGGSAGHVRLSERRGVLDPANRCV
jgi:hypothetical protein